MRHLDVDPQARARQPQEEGREPLSGNFTPTEICYQCAMKDERQYNKAEIVTHAGSMWHCNRSTRSQPGTDDSFTLCVKHGKDGKDLRG